MVQKSDTFFFLATVKMKASLFSVFFFLSPKSKTDEVEFIGI